MVPHSGFFLTFDKNCLSLPIRISLLEGNFKKRDWVVPSTCICHEQFIKGARMSRMGNFNICKITKSSFSLVNYCTLIRCEMRYYVYILNLLVWVPVKLSSTNFTFHHSANHKHSILTAFEYSYIYIAPILAVSLLKKIYALILQPKCRWLICLADFKVTREWHVWKEI